MIRIKNFLCLLLILAVGTGFTFGQNLMHYTSDRFEYSLKIPEDWKRNDELRGEKLALVLIAPDGELSINVSFYTMKTIDGNEFIDHFEKNMEKQLEEASIEEKGIFKARFDQATYLLIDYKKDGKSFREKLCFYQREKEMAVLTANNLKAEFHKSTPVLDEIFKSFTFETKQDLVDDLD